MVAVVLHHDPDPDPDPSYLEPARDSDDGFRARVQARREAYDRGDWDLVSVRAVAQVKIPVGGREPARQLIMTPGAWNVESDLEAARLRQIEDRELRTLRDMLTQLGFDPADLREHFTREETHAHAR